MTPRGCEPRLWRDVVARFYQLGGRPLRTRGSHQTWLLPRNERFTVVCNHLGDAVPKRILAQLRKLLARLSPDEAEPPLPPPCSGHGDPVEASGVFRPRGVFMSKNNSGNTGGKGGGGSSGGGKGGGNWPSGTGNPSGGGRGNAPPSK